MLISTDVLNELLKGPAPQGRPRGGKYKRREWMGTYWKYHYDEPGKTQWQQGESSDEIGLSVPGTIEGLRTRATRGVDPDKTYTQALSKAQGDVGKKFPLQLPTLDDKLTVHVNKKGLLEVTDGDGYTLGGRIDAKKFAGFKTEAHYEAWCVGISNTITKHNIDGDPWLDVKPRIGIAGNEIYMQGTEDARSWQIAYSADFPGESKKEGRAFAKSITSAASKIDKMYADQERSKSSQESGPLESEEPSLAQRKADLTKRLESKKDLSKDEKKAYLAAVGDDELIASAGTVSDDLQSGEYSWRWNEAERKNELNVSASKKDALVREMAREFWPKIVAMSGVVTSQDPFVKNKSEWQARFAGVGEMPKERKPTNIAIDPESPTYHAIARTLDAYDPSFGIGVAGLLAGKQGILRVKMNDWSRRQYKDEIERTESLNVRKKGKEKEGQEKIESVVAEEPSGIVVNEDNFETWSDGIDDLFIQWKEQSPTDKPEVRELLESQFDNVLNLDPNSENTYRVAELLTSLIAETGATKYVAKSIFGRQLELMLRDDLAYKAMQVLTRDKNVDPTHQYDSMSGGESNPKYYYTDQNGNYIRYTNAPTGNSDRSSYYGDPAPYAGEPMMEGNPEYFTPDGQKLTRCPECEVEEIEWNEKYNRYDPQNLWAGRWPDRETGKLQYTYLDSDIRQMPKLQIHQQNALTDVRLPFLRQTVADMFASGSIKDQITAVVLALMDQGRVRAAEISMLTSADVKIEGSIIQLGTRKVHGDYKLIQAISSLMQSRDSNEPLFSVPVQKKDGNVDASLRRRIGSNYLAQVLDQLGVSLIGLQTYHASITFSREVQRLLTQYESDWYTAMQSALMAVALEWGHDFTVESDAPYILQLIQAVLVDPTLVETLEQHAEREGLTNRVMTVEAPPVMIPIPHVSLDLIGATPEEMEFSQWLHNHPIHEHAEAVE